MSYEENKKLIGRLLLSLVFLGCAAIFLSKADYPLYEMWKPDLYAIGKSLFLVYGIPFEVASLLILAAVFGAIHLVRREET